MDLKSKQVPKRVCDTHVVILSLSLSLSLGDIGDSPLKVPDLVVQSGRFGSGLAFQWKPGPLFSGVFLHPILVAQ